jgi:nucleolar MIF4G domain-containing protein 1
VDACLLYDILSFMAKNFTPKDVELILACLRTVGFRLRKDDPIALKSLIILIQEKATQSKSVGSR